MNGLESRESDRLPLLVGHIFRGFASPERWQSGRMRRFAKPLYGLTPVPRVRIPPSPPVLLPDLSAFPTRKRPSSLHVYFTVCSEPPHIAPFGQSVGRLCNRGGAKSRVQTVYFVDSVAWQP